MSSEKEPGRWVGEVRLALSLEGNEGKILGIARSSPVLGVEPTHVPIVVQ